MKKAHFFSHVFLLLLLIGLLAGCTRAASESDGLLKPSPVQPTASGSKPGLIPPTGIITGAQNTQTVSSTVPLTTSAPPEVLPAAPLINEVAVRLIPLAGELASGEAEISGMAWYSDTLVLMPQYPERFGSQPDEGFLFGIKKQTILDYLAGRSDQAITPLKIPIQTRGLGSYLNGYEGFESIAFDKDQVILSVETRPGIMKGYLVRGRVLGGLAGILMDNSRLREIPAGPNLSNMSYEAIVIFGERLLTLFEANGEAVNPAPFAPLFTLDLSPVDRLAMPNVEYRITDASEVDENGRFWVINYLFPGDIRLQPEIDRLGLEFGFGPSHLAGTAVERLVEFQFTETGLQFTPQGYLLLELGEEARNWEALARLDELGFLIATDKFPGTLFGFVEMPATR